MKSGRVQRYLHNAEKCECKATEAETIKVPLLLALWSCRQQNVDSLSPGAQCGGRSAFGFRLSGCFLSNHPVSHKARTLNPIAASQDYWELLLRPTFGTFLVQRSDGDLCSAGEKSIGNSRLGLFREHQFSERVWILVARVVAFIVPFTDPVVV